MTWKDVTNLDEPQTQQEVRFGCPLILSPEREGKQWSGSRRRRFDDSPSVVGNLRHVLVAEGRPRGGNANRNRALEKTGGLDESQGPRRRGE